MAASTAMDALIAELLGDVGLLTAEMARLKQTTDAFPAAAQLGARIMNEAAAAAIADMAAAAAAERARLRTRLALAVGAAALVGAIVGGAIGAYIGATAAPAIAHRTN